MTSGGGFCDVTDKIVLVHLVTVQMTLEQKWRHMGACVTSRTILALPTGRRTKYNIYRVVPTPSQPADHRNGRTTRLRDYIDSTNSWPQKWANDKVEGLCRLYHGWPQKWANDKVVWCHKPRRLLNWFIAPGGWRDLDKSLFSITPRDGVTGLL